MRKFAGLLQKLYHYLCRWLILFHLSKIIIKHSLKFLYLFKVTSSNGLDTVKNYSVSLVQGLDHIKDSVLDKVKISQL